VANDGPGRAEAQLKTFPKMANFLTLRAEVGRRMLAAPLVESIPRGTNIVPRVGPWLGNPTGMSPNAFRATFAVSPGRHSIRAPTPVGTDTKEGAVPSPPAPLAPPGLGPSWGADRAGEEAGVHLSPVLPPPAPCVRRSAGLLLGLQNTRLRRV